MMAAPSLENSAVGSGKSRTATDYGKPEHLIWEPGFMRRFGVSLICLGAASGLATQSLSIVLTKATVSASAKFLPFVMGLLSSSCCALQLLLNALSLGCGGFNNWLGPIRPQLLALTVGLQ